MSYYRFHNWMTDPVMPEMDPATIDNARTVLTGWSDSKVRRVARYLERIAILVRSHKWAMKAEHRSPPLYLTRLSPRQRLAVNILRLAAKDSEDDADKDLYKEERERLGNILSQQRGDKEAIERVAPELKKAASYGDHQRGIAQRPRGKIGDEGEKLSEIITNLAHGEGTAKMLWPLLFSKLDDMGLNPNEDPEKWQIEYDLLGGRKTMTFKSFANAVSKARAGKKKSH